MAFDIVCEPEEVPFEEFRKDQNETEEREQILNVETPKPLAASLDTFIKNEPSWNPEDDFFPKEKVSYSFRRPPHPWLPPAVLKKIGRMKKSKLGNKDLVDLFGDIAQISTDYYDLKHGSVVAIKLDGRIAESAESQAELLFKIQGKKFDIPIFVWKVGSTSFAGWKSGN